MAGNQDFNAKQVKLIQDAHAKGKKTVTVDGVKLSIRKIKREVNFVTGGESKKHMETWLIASPVEKDRLTPVFNIAPRGISNSRVTT